MKKKINKFKWKVSSSENLMRLLSFIQVKISSSFSNKQIKKQLEKGICRVNGKVETFASKKVKFGDIIELENVIDKGINNKRNHNIKINVKVLFEDDYFFIINKPSGVESSQEGLRKYFSKDYLLVHRLDKGTSGVLILAKNEKVKDAMKKLFSEKKVNKKYIAIVDGKVKQEKWKVVNYLKKDDRSFGKIKYRSTKAKERGLLAETHFETIVTRKKFSVISCIPITGRTHQLRVHLSESKHPILGDYIYAQKFVFDKYIDRLMLHAKEVQFPHPFEKKKIFIKAPIPKDFKPFLPL